jgi:hypothetical protein
VLSCIFGYLLSSSGEYNEDTLFWHQWMGIAVAVVSLLAWYLKVIGDIATMKKDIYLLYYHALY